MTRSPWFWVPSLYYAEGIPYVVAMTVSVIMYKRLGISNTDIALYTSWLYLPWVIKPLWSPLVEIFGTKRRWIYLMQLVIGAAFACVALTIPAPDFFRYSLVLLWLIAFNSATHDIAADGFYILGLDTHQQAWFVGIRSTFYRLSMLTGQGLLVMLAGFIESNTGLGSVKINVTSSVQENSAVIQSVFPEPENMIFKLDEGGPLKLCSFSGDNVKIPIQTCSKNEVSRIVCKAKEWNGLNEKKEDIKNKGASAGWWKSNITRPLENVITKNFGKKKSEVKNEEGNIGIAYIGLNRKPEEGSRIVVNFGQKKGDKSIKVIEGVRKEFTSENWDRPLMSVIKLDPQLKTAASAEFVAVSGNIRLSWSIVFIIIAIAFGLFSTYHFFMLPFPETDKPGGHGLQGKLISEFFRPFLSFFQKDGVVAALLFLLFYRLGESQLLKLASPFMLDSREMEGLNITTGQVGLAYGTFGILMLTIGGIIGGMLAARHGLKKWIWWMALSINLPHLLYVYMSMCLPENFTVITACVALEQLGYGFGFAAYMLFMVYFVEDSEYKTAHYAIMTGFMALGMMIPGMWSGWLQSLIGYPNFFIWVFLCIIPCFIAVGLVKIDPDFGKKK
ncbi:MAG: hypothetical protein WC637_16560 [Victivallales bacterium]|jgi:PAT family beta-lactamase induction signal transducer AmpG